MYLRNTISLSGVAIMYMHAMLIGVEREGRGVLGIHTLPVVTTLKRMP